jgi:hypothetical protein
MLEFSRHNVCMHAGDRAASGAGDASALGTPARRWQSLRWTGGGTDGNEELTAAAGVILLVLLAMLGITIVMIGQLISEHLFLGLLLLGPVTLKMASTGYRFVRYYSRDPQYVRKGPPELALRMIGPIVVLTTVVVFASGTVLMFLGPAHRSLWLGIHKVSFFVWGGFMAVHVLGHLPGLGASLKAARASDPTLGNSPGYAGRSIALVGAVVAGLVLAMVLIPQFSAWTAHGVFVHHHHGG